MDTPTNVAGLTFTNTAYYTYNEIDGDPATQQIGDPGTSPPMTVVEPDLVMTKTGPLSADIGVPETFTLDVHNIGGSPAYAVTLTDLLPNDADGGMCDVPPQNITAQVFEADGTTPVSPVLAEGTDFTWQLCRRSDLLTDALHAVVRHDHRRGPAPDRDL